ncbi:DEAD/DEAH box helicase [Allofranklinella schreckenbergeri]|uniref:DEAD/DEAH box helicase n=1 Tax=Allofranklinella schreckenbergeri TaxID=1076744 RepID=A0A3M6PXB7_9BURK|nr:DEAD/DEAH box helicase [Allofranklinella schreckenbergeri]RMW95475.1 DEAD/DEAH box helicase [Allofranklinella schreckenbergeri]
MTDFSRPAPVAGALVAPVLDAAFATPASADTPVADASAFAALGLAPALVQAVAELGYTQPTVVQAQAIPFAMQGAGPNADAQGQGYCDLMVSSQTGSGKTAAFLLPVLHSLIAAHEARKAAEQAAFEQRVAEALAQGQPAPKKPKRKNPLNRRFEPATPGALVLCPTRELAAQVARDAIDLLQHCRGVRVASVIGGLPYPKQVAQLQNAALVVATPGRLLDLQRSGQLVLDQVQCLVVDEADRMLDLGFAEDLEAIHHLTAARRQTMMFSATFAPRIQQLGMRVMHEGGAHVQRIEVASAQQKHADITQKLFWADSSEHKRELLDAWLRDASIEQAIVFASTQIECDALAEDLQQAGFSAVALHGAMPQGLRNRRLAALRDGRVHILVATDVAARGIDVPSISHVFNYGLPMKSEDYTHRIGRTGRAGRHGLAISFAEFRDRRRIYDIEQFTRQPFEIDSLPGLEPRQRFAPWRPAPAGQGRGGRSQGRPSARGDGRNSHRPYREYRERNAEGGHGRARFDDRSGERFGGYGDSSSRFDARPQGRGGKRFDAGQAFDKADKRFDARPGKGRAAGRFEDWREGGAESRFDQRRTEARGPGRWEGDEHRLQRRREHPERAAARPREQGYGRSQERAAARFAAFDAPRKNQGKARRKG